MIHLSRRNLMIAMIALGCDPRGGENPPRQSPLKYPVVLHHGFNASPKGEWGFSDKIINGLKAQGYIVYVSQVNPYNSSQERGRELLDFIKGKVPDGRVHIVAHSQGGLDAWWASSPQGGPGGARIASITTRSSPHGGTFISDVLLYLSDNEALTDTMPAKLQSRALPAGKEALGQLTAVMSWGLDEETREKYKDHYHPEAAHLSMAEGRKVPFSVEFPASTLVTYLSWAGVSHVGGLSGGEAVEHKVLDACNFGLQSSAWQV